MSYAPLKALLVFWALALVAPHHASASPTLFTVFKRWSLPNHGEGKYVIVSPATATEAGLTAVAEELRRSAPTDQEAFVLIFTDSHAAALYQRGAQSLEEQSMIDQNFVGKYVRNHDTQVHELEIFPSGINGPSKVIAYA